MVKVDIVSKLQRQEGGLFGESEAIINNLLDIIKDTLESGEEIMISGFGRFYVRDKPSRPGRDPKSGIEYEIRARRVVSFAPSKVWRQEVNKVFQECHQSKREKLIAMATQYYKKENEF